MTLYFLRNKVVEVEPRDDGSLSVLWRLVDDLLNVELSIRVQPPDLEIVEAGVRMGRFVPAAWKSVPELVKKIEGVRVGSGLRKITSGLLGGPDGCPLLAHAVLESANAVILHYTRPGIESRESLDPQEKIARLRETLATNPRLVRSCIAFQDESPIMQGLDLKEVRT
ncbi:MAG: hypothetical protein A4E73_02798 [Syntrophaceae bacterium PtaU1.Bin231]|nr:MAG: hypothetical protein A4E73_02798 [Syntrophaceae bacterium PtaU1.Bin231]